jgi:hypothetical protein
MSDSSALSQTEGSSICFATSFSNVVLPTCLAPSKRIILPLKQEEMIESSKSLLIISTYFS